MSAVKPIVYKSPSSVKSSCRQCLPNYSYDEDRAQRASNILVFVEIQAKKCLISTQSRSNRRKCNAICECFTVMKTNQCVFCNTVWNLEASSGDFAECNQLNTPFLTLPNWEQKSRKKTQQKMTSV